MFFSIKLALVYWTDNINCFNKSLNCDKMSSYSLLLRENGGKIHSCSVVFTQLFLSGKKIAQEISKNSIYSIKYYNASFPKK